MGAVADRRAAMKAISKTKNKVKAAAVKVAAAAGAGNAKAGENGIGKTCGGCHNAFRAKKSKKKKAKFRNLFSDITFGERAVLMDYPF